MDLTPLSLAAAGQLLERRELSSLQLIEFYLDRIARYDAQLNTFIAVTADLARAQARQADAEMASGRRRSALHGIPIGLKDLFDVRGVRTTAGSRILRDHIAASDSAVATRLFEAGAVLLGKNNMHEFAFGVTNENPHYGDVKNPYDHARISGGSSGGSAAAVAARFCLASMGSDTGGSIRIPSALCGVTGLKPTYGRVSLRGVIPLSWSNDHAGPIAQTAEDCALLLNAIAGYDPADPVTVNVPVPDYTATLNDSLRGLRFAAPRGYFAEQVSDDATRAMSEVVRVLKDLGAVQVDKDVPRADEMFDANRVMLRAEASVYHQQNLERRADEFGVDVLKRLQAGQMVPQSEYVRERRRQVELTRELELWFEDVDFLVVPTTQFVATRRGGDAVTMAGELTRFTAPFDLTGCPAVTVPCGHDADGLPLGVEFAGPKWQEGLVLRVAHQYQRVTDWHKRIPPLS